MNTEKENTAQQASFDTLDTTADINSMVAAECSASSMIESKSSAVSQFEAYLQIVAILRTHCPWDREQTHETLASLLIEEAYEATDAIYKANPDAIAEELGDVLLHIVMHSLIAEEVNAFTLKDVIQGSAMKMVKRHPHVFGDKAHLERDAARLGGSSANEILKMWEHIKTKENRKSVMDGVPNALPSLVKADRIQQKASNIGFDWKNTNGAWDKVFEEVEELKAEIDSGNKEHIEEEFGDLLFSLVNVARFLNITPENALQKANNKFIKRFQYMEEYARNAEKSLSQMSIDEMNAIWNLAKSKG